MKTDRIQSLKNQIAELKSRWPAHSVPPAMFQELEDLEEELEAAINQYNKEYGAEENSGN